MDKSYNKLETILTNTFNSTSICANLIAKLSSGIRKTT